MRVAATVSAFATVLRLIWVIPFTRSPKGVADPLLYLIAARRISEGAGYTSLRGFPTAYYPPGYPYFLGLIRWVLGLVGMETHLVRVVTLLQAVMGGLTAGLVVLLAIAVVTPHANSRRGQHIGVLSGVVIALWPNLIVQSSLILSETLFLLVYTAALYAAILVLPPGAASPNTRHLVTTMALVGLGTLIRPQSILILVPVLILVWAFCGLKGSALLRVTGLFIVATGLFVLPWTIRNAVRMHAFVPLSTNVGDNLCIGFNPESNGGFVLSSHCMVGAHYSEGIEAELHQNSAKTERALQWARQNLSELPELSAKKVWLTMNHDNDAMWTLASFGRDQFLDDQLFNGMKRISNVYYKSSLVLAAAGLVITLRRLRADSRRYAGPLIMLAAIPAGLIAPLATFGDPRFKAPLIPSIAVLVGITIVTIAGRFSDAPNPVPKTKTQLP